MKRIKELISYSGGGVLSKQVARSKSLDITLFCMAEGTEISKHTSTKEGMVFVVEGKGIFNLEGEDIIMKPGIAFLMKKNAVHWIKVEENTSFILSLW